MEPAPQLHRNGYRVEAGREPEGYWRELWERRELLGSLSSQALRLRYRQTWAGPAWVLLRPTLLTLAFLAAFRVVAGMDSPEGAPYALTVLAGVVPWLLFSGAVTGACPSVTQGAALLSRADFPRIFLPLAACAPAAADFGVATLLCAAIAGAFGRAPGGAALAEIALAGLLTLSAGLGLGLWGAALNVRHRDVSMAAPFFLQLLMFVSPIGFATAAVPGRWLPWLRVNPVTAPIELYRHALLPGAPSPDPAGLALGAALSLAALGTGALHFKRAERAFAELA